MYMMSEACGSADEVCAGDRTSLDGYLQRKVSLSGRVESPSCPFPTKRLPSDSLWTTLTESSQPNWNYPNRLEEMWIDNLRQSSRYSNTLIPTRTNCPIS